VPRGKAPDMGILIKFAARRSLRRKLPKTRAGFSGATQDCFRVGGHSGVIVKNALARVLKTIADLQPAVSTMTFACSERRCTLSGGVLPSPA